MLYAVFMGRLEIHFDGPIAADHMVSVRTLGKSLQHLQSSIDRAYLDTKYNGIWKYARMSPDDYGPTEFLVMAPRDGGYILDFKSKVEQIGDKILDRINRAILPAYNEAAADGLRTFRSIAEQVENNKIQIENRMIEVRPFEDFVSNPPREVTRKYGDRSIAKEIDQVASLVRVPGVENSTVELTIKGTGNEKTYLFDRHKSQKFHKIVSSRQLGNPMLFVGAVQSLDRKNKNGKIINVSNQKTSTLHFGDDESFLKAHPFLGTDSPMTFIGCPFIEYGAYDPQAGDIYFIKLANEEE